MQVFVTLIRAVSLSEGVGRVAFLIQAEKGFPRGAFPLGPQHVLITRRGAGRGHSRGRAGHRCVSFTCSPLMARPRRPLRVIRVGSTVLSCQLLCTLALAAGVARGRTWGPATGVAPGCGGARGLAASGAEVQRVRGWLPPSLSCLALGCRSGLTPLSWCPLLFSSGP